MQACKMTMGSWTHDNKAINYFPYNGSKKPAISTKHCLSNEEWTIIGTKVLRSEVKFDCCTNNYTLLDFYIHIRRKPLFYLVNLIAPTGIITLIAIVGFFSSPTVNDVREEKMTLGITTLLSMSILLFMISDKMPSMGSSVPLIGWFYASNMTLIGTATLAASIVIYTQKKGIVGHRPSRSTMKWARRFGKMLMIKMPLLMLQAYALKAKQEKMKKQESQRKMSVWQRWQKIGKDLRRPTVGTASLLEDNSPSRKTTLTDMPRDLMKHKRMRFKKRSITELTFNSEAMRFADEDIPSSDEEKSYDGSTNANGSIGGRENPNFSTSRTTSFSSPHQINHINKSYYGDNNNEYFNGEGCNNRFTKFNGITKTKFSTN
uniref:Neurotransmitter-gated ion-channel transmembrane domain-containing protein n=1 Tax=Panagrolaimus superbus TaxID=310955 RepID=A0A914ZEB3_9BILA